MSEVENKPVDVPAAEPAPAEDTAGVDLKTASNAVKKVDKKSLLAKLKAIIKKVLPSKKAVSSGTTDEPASEGAAPVEPETAPTTTAVA